LIHQVLQSDIFLSITIQENLQCALFSISGFFCPGRNSELALAARFERPALRGELAELELLESHCTGWSGPRSCQSMASVTPPAGSHGVLGRTRAAGRRPRNTVDVSGGTPAPARVKAVDPGCATDLRTLGGSLGYGSGWDVQAAASCHGHRADSTAYAMGSGREWRVMTEVGPVAPCPPWL
jgi:hypothetical protein